MANKRKLVQLKCSTLKGQLFSLYIIKSTNSIQIFFKALSHINSAIVCIGIELFIGAWVTCQDVSGFDLNIGYTCLNISKNRQR